MYDESNEQAFDKYELILKIWFIIFILLNILNIVIFGIYSGYSMIIPLLLPFVHTFVAVVLILVLSTGNTILIIHMRYRTSFLGFLLKMRG